MCASGSKKEKSKEDSRKKTNLELFDRIQKTISQGKKIIKKTKKETWRKFCNTISAETPSRRIWNMIRKMSGKGKQNSPPLIVNGQTIDNPKQKADTITRNIDETQGQEPTRINEEQANTIRESLQFEDEADYNTSFTLHELNDSLDALKPGKAMGDDEVENEFLKNLPEHKKLELLKLINQSWIESTLPTSWKHSLVLPILKEGKDATDPTSYRPISLISCVSKVAEKMINNRLTWQLETTNKFSPTQSGFRKGRSAEDHIINFEHQIRSCLKNRNVNVSVFLP